MIEKKIVSNKLKMFQIEEYMANMVDKPGYSHTEMQKTPLGEKIIIHTSKPGLIVGRKGEIIISLTQALKNKFNLENPQIEVVDVVNPNLNPHTVAKSIVHTFERFGPKRFKFIGHKMLETIMNVGATGAEIVISGRGVPGARAKTWRFTAGHLKKSGDIAENFISRSYSVARLKSGAIGVKVIILTPDIILPDRITINPVKEEKEVKKEHEETLEQKEEVKEEKKEQKVEVKRVRKKKEEKVEEVKEEKKVERKKKIKDGDTKK